MLEAAAEFWRNFRGYTEPREKLTFGSRSTTSGSPLDSRSGGDGLDGEPSPKLRKTGQLMVKLYTVL